MNTNELSNHPWRYFPSSYSSETETTISLEEEESVPISGFDENGAENIPRALDLMTKDPISQRSFKYLMESSENSRLPAYAIVMVKNQNSNWIYYDANYFFEINLNCYSKVHLLVIPFFSKCPLFAANLTFTNHLFLKTIVSQLNLKAYSFIHSIGKILQESATLEERLVGETLIGAAKEQIPTEEQITSFSLKEIITFLEIDPKHPISR